MKPAPAGRLPTHLIHLVTWPSLALGVAATCCLVKVARLVGLDPTRTARLIRWAGWRELLVLAGFWARPVPRSLWWFLAQDACDLGVGAIIGARHRQLIVSRRRFRFALLGYVLLAVGDSAIWLRSSRRADPA